MSVKSKDADFDSTDGYTLPVNGRGRIPPPDRTSAPDPPNTKGILLRNRRTGKLQPHARVGSYNPVNETVTVRIDDEAFPEFWCEVDLKREDLEEVLPPPKKKRCMTWIGQLDIVKDLVDSPSICKGRLIDQFFEWKGDPRLTGFRDCTLKEDLGAFKAGDEFCRVDMPEGRSMMELFLKEHDILPTACFSLQLLAKQIE